jgi:transposase InsO family protein
MVGTSFDKTGKFAVRLDSNHYSIYRRKYSTIEEVRKDIYWYIEMLYNRKRRHSSLEYMTPIAYRQRYDEMKAA